MRIAVVTAAGIPNPDANGAVLANWALIGQLLRQGHEVGVCAVHDRDYQDPAGLSAEERFEALRRLGAGVRPVLATRRGSRRLLAHALRPRDEELLPELADIPAVRAAVEELEPDAAFVYGWGGVAASRGLKGLVPRLGVVVDLAHLPPLYRFRAGPKPLSRQTLAQALTLQAGLRRLPRLQVELLSECEAAGDFAAHHAEWLRRKGLERCAYLRTPVEDAAGGAWRAERERRAAGARPRLLLIGHLHGTSTPDGLEIRLAGGWEPPPDLRDALARPSVRFLGHLKEPAEEFRTADALVVPTSVPLGARVRILSAFSFGCPVVAHASNALGIPELAHGANAMLGRTGAELADGFLRIVRDAALRRTLEHSGRETYERFFSPEVAAARIEEVLRSIARVRPATAPAAGRPPIPARP